MKCLLLLIVVELMFWESAFSQTPRNIISGGVSKEQLKEVLITYDNWKPYPKISDREDWKIVPEKLKKTYIVEAEKYIGKQWDVLPASVFLDFVRNGNRSKYQKVLYKRRKRLANLVFAEVFENKGRFTDEIVNGVWAICEETFWGVPAHLRAQKGGLGLPNVKDPYVDLFAAETGALMAWVDYLVGEKLDEVSPLIRERIYYEGNRKIIEPYLTRNDWGYMGFSYQKIVNNWNPWINSNVLTTVLFLEKDSERRLEAVHKIMRSVDVFVNGYPEDGGCDEGPGYWGRAGASLYDCLDLLYKSTNGEIDVFDKPLVRKIGQFIYKAWIADDYYINFADASAINRPDAGLIYRYGKNIDDPLMMGFGKSLAIKQDMGNRFALPSFGSPLRLVPNMFSINELLSVEAKEPYVSDFWLPGLQLMGAREHHGTAKGFYLAAKGGHNAESHNHNDVGSFIVYHDSKPLLIDVGVETYTKKTFSRDRYSIWTMQSQYHNLPTINGEMQQNGRAFKAEGVIFVNKPKSVTFSLDIAKAYPEETKIDYWKRSIILKRKRGIKILEDYKLLQCDEPVVLNYMTVYQPNVTKPGEVILGKGNRRYVLRYNDNAFSAISEEIKITDARLSPVWGEKVYRLMLVAKDCNLIGKVRVEIKAY